MMNERITSTLIAPTSTQEWIEVASDPTIGDHMIDVAFQLADRYIENGGLGRPAYERDDARRILVALIANPTVKLERAIESTGKLRLDLSKQAVFPVLFGRDDVAAAKVWATVKARDFDPDVALAAAQSGKLALRQVAFIAALLHIKGSAANKVRAVLQATNPEGAAWLLEDEASNAERQWNEVLRGRAELEDEKRWLHETEAGLRAAETKVTSARLGVERAEREAQLAEIRLGPFLTHLMEEDEASNPAAAQPPAND